MLTPGTSIKARKKARQFLLQALYSWKLSGNALQDIEMGFMLRHNPKKYDQDYFHRLLHAIPQSLAELNQSFKGLMEIPFDRLDPIEHCILLIASYELMHQPEIPFRVVINEALELAKTFGAVESHKFINGVLDQLAKRVRMVELSTGSNFLSPSMSVSNERVLADEAPLE